MKTTSIDTINNDLADGAVIQAFSGKLIKLYELRTIGAGTDREWTKQNGELQAADGQKIQVEFRRNGDEVPTGWKNKTLLFESVKGDKGTHGIKVIDDTHNGKTTRKLCITGTAEMSFLDGDAGAPTEQRQKQQHSEPEQQTRQQSRPASAENRGTAQQGSGDPMKTLRLRIAKRATVWQICYDTAVASALCVAERHGFAMVPAGVGSLTSSLYIDTIRGLDLDSVEINAIDWKPAKGRNMRDLIANLNEQIAHTRTAQQGTAGAGEIADHKAAPPASQQSQFQKDMEEDEIPF